MFDFGDEATWARKDPMFGGGGGGGGDGSPRVENEDMGTIVSADQNLIKPQIRS